MQPTTRRARERRSSIARGSSHLAQDEGEGEGEG